MGANAYRTITLYLIVISAIDVPLFVIDAFRLPVRYYLGSNPPWLIWACLPILWFNIARNSTVGRGRLTVDREDLYFLFVMAFWCYVAWAQGLLVRGSPGQTWFNLYLVTTNMWFYFYYYLLKTYESRAHIQARLVNVAINTVSWMSAAHVLLYILAVVGGAYFANLDIYEHNGVATVAVFGTFLLLFHRPIDIGFSKTWLLVGVNVTVVLLNQSRAALVVLIVLLAWKFVALKKPLVVAGAVSVAALAVIFVDMETVRVLGRGLIFGLAIADQLARESLLPFLPDNLQSAFARNAANFLLVQEFLQHPVAGIGMDQAYAIRAGGYMSHTYYLFPLAAYGLLGTFLYVVYFVVWPLRAGYRRNRHTTIATLLFLFGTMTFLNDWRAWYAIPFFLMLGEERPQAAWMPVRSVAGASHTNTT